MSCKIYIQKYDYTDVLRGQRKQRETANGRALLSYAVSDTYGISADSLVIKTGEHGKPYFDGCTVQFNISHSGDYAAAAVCDLPVGIDIQCMRRVKDKMIERLCSSEELEYISSAGDKDRAFIRLWALKESYIKAIGMGMAFPMDKINFDIRGTSDTISGRISNREGLYYMTDCGDYAFAACVLV